MDKNFRLEEIQNIVEEFVSFLLTNTVANKATVVGFSGNLGAGKTTFTKELLKRLGFEGNVVSPTFVLRRDYLPDVSLVKLGGINNIIHIDAYRLEKPEQIYQVISKEELADKNNFVIIEWPEKVFDNENSVGENIFDKIFYFEHVDESTRRLRG